MSEEPAEKRVKIKYGKMRDSPDFLTCIITSSLQKETPANLADVIFAELQTWLPWETIERDFYPIATGGINFDNGPKLYKVDLNGEAYHPMEKDEKYTKTKMFGGLVFKPKDEKMVIVALEKLGYIIEKSTG